MAAAEYDVVVIGSGAAGGMAAWNLTRKGVKVLVLEAGDSFDPSSYWSHVKPWEARERLKRGDRGPAFESLPLRESPYETPEGQSFLLRRVWGVGGKTNIWGRVSLRYGDLNFSETSHRRVGNPLASAVQRHRSVLRQRGKADRRLWWG